MGRSGEGSGRPLRPVGQALGTYLVLEGADEVVLIDQHALHERVLFEALLHHEGRHATREELLLAHDAAYVGRVAALGPGHALAAGRALALAQRFERGGSPCHVSG